MFNKRRNMGYTMTEFVPLLAVPPRTLVVACSLVALVDYTLSCCLLDLACAGIQSFS